MGNRAIEQISIGSIVALITALINQAFAGKINYWWIIGTFLTAIFFYTVYQNYSGYPFQKYRVADKRDNRCLLFFDGNRQATGSYVDDAWGFRSNGSNYHPIHGPYLREPLRKGKYRVTFRIKIDKVGSDNTYITYLDVVSSLNGQKGGKTIAGRTITSHDFRKSDDYHDLHLDFEIFSDEPEIEFRIAPTNNFFVTLDYAKLTRRLF